MRRLLLGACLGLTLLAPGRLLGEDDLAQTRPAQPTGESVPQPTFFERLFGVTRPAPPVVVGKKHLVVICGLTGNDDFRDRFTRTSYTLIDVLTSRGGFDKELVQLYLGDEQMADDPDLSPWVKGDSRQETLKQLAESLVETIEPADTLWLMVIGHTYFDGRRVWLNLPGDDINEETFGEWFAPIGGRESVYWLTMPTSGFFVKPLSQPGRIIITATEADREVIATEFPHMLADVLESPTPASEQDQDRDGRVSLLDLYLLTARRVAASFQERELVATEHAWLDDNGDRRGTEVQRYFLPEELEGTLEEGESPRPLVGKADGVVAQTMLLPQGLLRIPEESPTPDADAPDADAEASSPDE